MKEIKTIDITNALSDLLIKACCDIPSNILEALKKCQYEEESTLGREVVKKIIENDEQAKRLNKPLCQDTGIVVCFVELGYDVHLDGDLYEAINKGVSLAYTNGYLRKSVVSDPLNRVNTKDNTPAITYVKLVPGDKLKITVLPKGAGSENMSSIKMLTPADGVDGVKKFVLETVRNAGGKPCPPIVVGVGIGGNFERCAMLAKEALTREIDDVNPNEFYKSLEEELLEEINALGIGPMGFGGTKTCLSVKINSYPCHIASMPVAVNIQCHASRHQTIEF